MILFKRFPAPLGSSSRLFRARSVMTEISITKRFSSALWISYKRGAEGSEGAMDHTPKVKYHF